MAKIDLSYLEEVASGDESFVKQMLEMFKSSTVTELDKIDQYYAKQDWAMVGLTAHKIKAPIQMLGQNELADMVVMIEKLGKNYTEPNNLAEMIRNLRLQIEELYFEVDSLVNSL